MNPFEDERLREAEQAAFDAERAERRGGEAGGRELWARAAALYGEVARGIEGHPKYRAVLAVSHVVCLGRGGARAEAVEEARRWAADPDIPPETRLELEALAARYGSAGNPSDP